MIETKIETINPDKAREYLEWNKHNRPVNKKTVSLYAREMQSGRWTLSNDAITFFENHILGNGQHRLYAIIQSGFTGEFLVMRGLPAETFTNIDQGRARSAQDILTVEDIPNASNVAAIVKRYLNMNNQLVQDTGRTVTPAHILETYKQHPDLFQEAYKVVAVSYRACRAMKMAEFGGMYAHLIIEKKHHPTKVVHFINECAGLEANTNSNTPQLLRTALINELASTSHKMTAWRRRGLLIKAWNYWVSGREVVRLNVDPKEKDLDFI